mgnify:CR=1 FL=1
MTATSTSLDELRREIDAIDDSLHALLMRRAEVQRRVGRAKEGSGHEHGNSAYIRPGREALVLRRLIANHDGPFPKAVVVRIWREIFAAGLSLQSPFSVAVLADSEGRYGLQRIARDHFGTLTQLHDMGTPSQVLRAVGEGRASLGVLPMPESEEAAPWWPSIARHGEGVPRIIARLPFARSETGHAAREALVVSLAQPEETGQDGGYIAVETPQETSRTALRRILETTGFEIMDWKVTHDLDGASYYLVTCRGVVRDDDPRLAALAASGDATVRQAWALGGYAEPLGPAELA